jgi:hypothetical protein
MLVAVAKKRAKVQNICHICKSFGRKSLFFLPNLAVCKVELTPGVLFRPDNVVR